MAEAGLVIGDRILAVDGQSVTSQQQMLATLAAAEQSVRLDVDRKGRIVTLQASSAPIKKLPIQKLQDGQTLEANP